MIKLLKQFVDWLDRRFPAKVYVSEQVFDELRRNEHLLRKNVTSLRLDHDTIAAEFAVLRKSVEALKESIAKGEVVQKAESVKLRESFIAGNFARGQG